MMEREIMKANSIITIIVFINLLSISSYLVYSQSDSCTSNVNLKFLPFDTTSMTCVSAWDSQNFILRYKQTSPSIWSFVLSTPTPTSYIAIGFSSNGQMVGSSAIVGWMSSNGGMMKRYSLQGTTPSRVLPNEGSLSIVNDTSLIASQSNRVYLAFQLNTSQPESRILYSVGPAGFTPVSPNYNLIEHSSKISTSINYVSGQSNTQSTHAKLRKAHGVINMLSWGILMIIGVIVARHFKEWDPLWFYLHVGIQSSAFILGIVGIICGFILEDKVSANVSTHKGLGIFILVLGCLQVMALLARPDKGSKFRFYWNWYHYTVGRVLLILAIANAFYGIHLGEKGRGWNAGYAIVVAALIFTSLVLEIRSFRKNH